MMMGHFYGAGPGSMFSWFGMGLGLIMHLAFTALVVFGAIWLYKAAFRNYNAGGQSSALEILKQRYAKGELTAEQFQSMKKEIE